MLHFLFIIDNTALNVSDRCNPSRLTILSSTECSSFKVNRFSSRGDKFCFWRTLLPCNHSLILLTLIINGNFPT